MCKAKKLLLLALLAVVSLTTIVQAGLVQVGDFRIGGNLSQAELETYVNGSGTHAPEVLSHANGSVFYHPGFVGIPTRPVAGFDNLVTSSFAGATARDAIDGGTYNINLASNTPDYTRIGRLALTVHRMGLVRWNIGLTDLETYLDDNFLGLSALEFRLNLAKTSAAIDYIYLSYTNPDEGIVMTDVIFDVTGWTLNRYKFIKATEDAGAVAGDIVDGEFKVLAKEITGQASYDLTESVLALYEAGVREFNLMLGSFGIDPGNTDILAGSGVFIQTATGMAHSPDPVGAGGLVNSAAYSSVSWYSPEQDSNGDAISPADPNLVSVDSYDVYWSDTSGDFSLATPDNQAGQSYTPGGGINEMTTYYWRVDTHSTMVGPGGVGTVAVVTEGPAWQFTTRSLYYEPVVTADDVVSYIDILPATVSALVTENTDTLYPSVFTITGFPAGGDDAELFDLVAAPGNPTTTLMTDTAGLYTVNLAVSDGTTTVDTEIIVEVSVDSCEAEKAAGTWTANYYDRDGNCVVDISDLAVFAVQWLQDSGATGQAVRP